MDIETEIAELLASNPEPVGRAPASVSDYPSFEDGKGMKAAFICLTGGTGPAATLTVWHKSWEDGELPSPPPILSLTQEQVGQLRDQLSDAFDRMR